MDKYYRIIATLQLQHQFFTGKTMGEATIVPFPETSLFFKNHRMIFKRRRSQYVILQEAGAIDNEPTIRMEPALKELHFGINFNDQHYQLRSGLNFDPRKEKIVVRSLNKENYLITPRNVMPCRNSLPASDDNASLEITDVYNKVVYSSAANDNIPFNQLPIGIYMVNGVPFLKCNHCSEYDAVLIFQLEGSEHASLTTITMPAGSYLWRYKIRKKYTTHNSLSLVDENEKVIFNRSDPTAEDTVFISSEPVALSDVATASLILYNNESIVKKYLPLPALGSARFLSAEEKSLILETYITI